MKIFKQLKSWILSILFRFFTKAVRAPRSKGEREVIEYLTENGFNFKRELRIPCSGNFQRNVYIDFFLPKENIFIEYNGRQHYEPVEYFGGQDQFERQQKRDAWVRNYCNEKGIRLIEIPYTEKVKTFLDKYL